MEQTANYQLNQWEKTDRIQMEDFNADNAKIDAALAEMAGKSSFVKLKEYTVESDSTILSIPASGMQLGDYFLLCLTLNLQGSGAFLFTVNGDTNYSYYTPVSATGTSQRGGIAYINIPSTAAHVWLPVSHSPTHKVAALTLGDQLTYGYCDRVTYENVTSLTFCASGSSQMTAGSTIQLWGLK